jgi:putative ABC transport system substrate-binding protein
MRRRDFITLLSGTMVIWPSAVRAQQREQIARIGVLMGSAAEDPEGQARITAFRQGLQKLGLTEGQNVRIDVRWSGGDAALERKFATELVTLTPDVILASASPTVVALQAVIRTVPIVFAGTIDPVGAGFVESLARPGGNTTGFVLFEYGMGAKWLELLKEIGRIPGRAR